MTLLQNLPHRCSANLQSRSQGTMGGGKNTSTTVFSNWECWRQPAGDSEMEFAAKRGIQISHKVYFTADPELDERHTLVFSDGEYNVVSRPVPDASVGLGVVYKVWLRHNSSED